METKQERSCDKVKILEDIMSIKRPGAGMGVTLEIIGDIVDALGKNCYIIPHDTFKEIVADAIEKGEADVAAEDSIEDCGGYVDTNSFIARLRERYGF